MRCQSIISLVYIQLTKNFVYKVILSSSTFAFQLTDEFLFIKILLHPRLWWCHTGFSWWLCCKQVFPKKQFSWRFCYTLFVYMVCYTLFVYMVCYTLFVYMICYTLFVYMACSTLFVYMVCYTLFVYMVAAVQTIWV